MIIGGKNPGPATESYIYDMSDLNKPTYKMGPSLYGYAMGCGLMRNYAF